MPTLRTNGQTTGLHNGTWSVTANMTSGTAQLQLSIAGGAFFDITGASFTQTDGGRITVPNCQVKAVLTGDAVFEIDDIQQR